MKKELLIPVVFIVLLIAGGCNQKPADEVQDSLECADSVVAVPDTTMWGHLGEGTSMHMLEFITESGDTMMLARSSERTGDFGRIVGDIGNRNDKFVITTQTDDGETLTLRSCINATQLMGVWKNGDSRLAMYVDGTADNESSTLKTWELINGQLVLSGTIVTEYGEMQRNDTLELVDLSATTLTYVTKSGEELTFSK